MLLSVSAKQKKFYFAINPIIDAEFGYDINSKKMRYTVGYGLRFDANLGRKVSLSFTYQGVTENYLQQVGSYASQYGVFARLSQSNI